MRYTANRSLIMLLVKRPLTLIACLLFPFIILAHPNPNTTDTLSLRDISRITIASEPDYPPYCFVDDEGNAQGFSIDLFKAAAKAAGIEVDVRIGLWSQIRINLAEGRIDALPLVGRTPEREHQYDFTHPYLSLHGAIFVKKSNRTILDVNDLKDKVVAVMQGDNAEEFLRRDTISNNIVTTHTFEEAFRLLEQGRADAVVTQRIMGIKLLESMGISSVVPLDVNIPQFRQDFCFAVTKGDIQLLNKLNEGLSIVIANKTYDDIYREWLGPELIGIAYLKRIIATLLYFLIPIVVLLAIIMNIFLRRQVKHRTEQLTKEVAGHIMAVEQLSHQQKMLRKVEQVAKIGGWEYNIKSGRVQWTEGTYDVFGYSSQEIDASTLENNLDLFIEPTKSHLAKAMEIAISKAEPYDLEVQIRTKQGDVRWAWTSGQPEVINGKVISLYGSIMDISESKLAELQAAESEIKFQEIFNSTTEAIIILDANTGSIVEVNDRTLEMYGYSLREEIINATIGDLSSNIDPYNQSVANDYMKMAIEEGLVTSDWQAKRKDGSTFWVETSLKYVILSGIERIISVVRDITARKKSEKELQKLNKKLLALFKASKPLQSLKTPEHLANEIIHVLEETLNYQFGSVLIVGDDGATIEPFAVSNQGKGEEFANADKELIRSHPLKVGEGVAGWVIQNGKSLIIGDVSNDSRYYPMRENICSELCVPIIVDFEIIGAINIESTDLNAFSHTDQRFLETMAAQIGIAIHNANLYQMAQKELTERQRVEEEIRELNEELERKILERTQELNDQVLKLDKSQKAMLFMVEDLNDLTEDLKAERKNLQVINTELESFSYSVSHDLRAPLRAIDGFSRILIEDYLEKLDKEGIRLLNIVRENAQRMDTLITDILSLSRVGRIEMNYSLIDMASMANSIFHEIAEKDELTNIEFTVGELPSVNGDTILMRLVWQNLIGNALKYSKPRAKRIIEVGGSADGDLNTYYVNDNGVGFSPTYQSKIFNPFQRLHRADEFEGSGIGLSIVKRIVHRHGGSVLAEGEEGKGAKFTFTIPRKG